jgi:hypothetical protein
MSAKLGRDYQPRDAGRGGWTTVEQDLAQVLPAKGEQRRSREQTLQDRSTTHGPSGRLDASSLSGSAIGLPPLQDVVFVGLRVTVCRFVHCIRLRKS